MQLTIFSELLMNKNRVNIGIFTAYIFCMHFLILLLMIIYRIIIIGHFQAYSLPQVNEYPEMGFRLMTLIQGLWRDNFLMMLVSLLVFVLVLGAYCFKRPTPNRLLLCFKIFYWFILTVFIILCAINIPYYIEFCKPIDIIVLSAMQGSNGSSIIKMIIGDSVYCRVLVSTFILLAVITYVIFRFPKNLSLICFKKKYATALLLIFGFVLFSFSMITRPRLMLNRADYSADYSLDKIALNPVAFFASSIINKNTGPFKQDSNYINVLNERQLDSCLLELKEEGIVLPRSWKGFKRVVSNSESGSFSPNVVLIIMEGLSARLMEQFGCAENNLTPYLDSLFNQSLSFPYCYSVGQRTQLGLSGILNSYPSLLTHGNLFNYSQACRFDGLAYQMHKNGYHNTFFIPHTGGFDGMRTYLETHDFDKVYSLEDYPKEMATITWGINDDKLFEYIIPKLNVQSSQNRPFFASILTISNHDPYEIPQYFSARNKQLKFQAVEYADWSIKKFFTLAKSQPWYENTIFILTADHGRVQQEKECELSDQMHHIPLIFFGKMIKPGICESMTSQMDIMAILMGLLGKSYECHNFSQDVVNNPREYVLYSAYDYLVCRSHDRLYLYRYDTGEDAYYMIEDNVYSKCNSDDTFQFMKKYCLTYFQSADNITLPFKQTEGWM